MGFKFTIEYREGKSNKVADALSRMPQEDSVTINDISVITVADFDTIHSEVDRDPFLQDIVIKLKSDLTAVPPDSLQQGQLFYKNRLVIPKSSSVIPTLLSEFHNGAIGGHAGYLKTYKRLTSQFFWLGMKSDIKRHVTECQICQQNKLSTLSPAGLLQPLRIPEKIWEDISMDFIEALPKSEGSDTIWVIVDRLSKYAHFIPLNYPFNAKDLARIFVKEVIRLHGIPKSVVSDRGSTFLGNFWQEIHKLQGTQLRFSSAYHPETDGQTEVVNKRLGDYLRCFASSKPHTWNRWLPWAEYSYNTSYHVSAKMTPFKIVYGHDPPILFRYGTPTSPIDDIDKYLVERDQTLALLKEKLNDAQSAMKSTKDKARRDEELSVGDWVYLKIRPYRMKSLAKRFNAKLAPKYFAPYQITKRIGAVAYKLSLPDGCRIHPVFHISQLCKVKGQHDKVLPLPAALFDQLEWIVEPQEIMDFRSQGSDIEILVRWKGLPDFEDTWESAHTIAHRFPSFQLEDKLRLLAGRDGRTPIITYQRRKKRVNMKNPEARPTVTAVHTR